MLPEVTSKLLDARQDEARFREPACHHLKITHWNPCRHGRRAPALQNMAQQGKAIATLESPSSPTNLRRRAPATVGNIIVGEENGHERVWFLLSSVWSWVSGSRPLKIAGLVVRWAGVRSGWDGSVGFASRLKDWFEV